MDIGAILETGVMIFLGYGIMFGIIVLLMLPFLYSINLYERMKNNRLVTDQNHVNPFGDESQNRFRFLEGIHKRHQKNSIKDNLTRVRNELVQQKRHIKSQREEIRKLSEVNQQLMSIVIKIRSDLRDG